MIHIRQRGHKWKKIILRRGCLCSRTPDKQQRYESNYGAKISWVITRYIRVNNYCDETKALIPQHIDIHTWCTWQRSHVLTRSGPPAIIYTLVIFRMLFLRAGIETNVTANAKNCWGSWTAPNLQSCWERKGRPEPQFPLLYTQQV